MKLRYYCREENQEISRQDIQSEAVQARIQSFMDSREFPAPWTDGEYTAYFEKIFGENKERQRKYISAILSEDKVTLSVGNRILGALMSEKLCRVVFTTNFDTVVEKAVAEMGDKSLSAYHLEGVHNAKNALDNEEYPFYCKLHGDFRYDTIKNLDEDLEKQNDELSSCLVNAGNRFGFIVAGYSGRDESVMKLLHRILETENPFPHGLYWTGIKGSDTHPAVSKLLEEAREKGVDAQAAPEWSGDALYELSDQTYSVNLGGVARKLAQARPDDVAQRIAVHGNAGSDNNQTLFGTGLEADQATLDDLVIETRHPLLLFRVQVPAGQLRYLFYSAADNELLQVCFGDAKNTRQLLAQFKEAQQRIDHPLVENNKELFERLRISPDC